MYNKLEKILKDKLKSFDSEVEDMTVLEMSKILPNLLKIINELESKKLEANSKKKNQEHFNIIAKKMMSDKDITQHLEEILAIISDWE